MELRDYQQAAIDSLFAWWAAGRQGDDPLIWLATGSGKTVIFSSLLKRLLTDYPGTSALVLAHRKELISQAEDKLLRIWPDAPVGVFAAGLGRRELNQITIASRDTIAGVVDAIGQFNFVIVDECHRMNAKDEGRYHKIIQSLRDSYEHLVVIGFTATPFRLGQGRIYGPGKPFADICYKKPMLEMIQEGYLAPLTSAPAVHGEIDTTGIRTTAGDFNEHDLEERAIVDELVQAALTEWKTSAYDQGRKYTVFFCVSILHATMVSEKLARMGFDVPMVTGETPDKERDELLAEFDAGQFPGIANVGVLTEGWDAPRVDCIALLRPTQSASLYVQMVGRGLRLSPETGKTDCLILDFGGNINRLGPVDQADEVEPKKKKKKKPQDAPYKTCGEWDHAISAFRDGCGTKNATAAVQCTACGQPFVKHDLTAARGGITSTERTLESFMVERITARMATSKSSGKDYIRISYQCGLFEYFYKNLMLGYEGYAGQRAAQEWASMTDGGTLPIDPYDAMDLLDSGAATFRPVEMITVDVASKWKNIMGIKYK